MSEREDETYRDRSSVCLKKKFVSARYNKVRLEQRAVLQITVKVLIVPSTEALLFYRPNDKSI